MGLFDFAGDIWDKVTGAGTSSYQAPVYKYDPNSFQDPYLSQNTQSFQQAIANANSRQAPLAQSAQLNLAPQNQFRGDQSALVSALTARANGQGPSAAELQLNQGLSQSLQNSAALAASSRGSSNPAYAMRQAQLANASASQGVNNQAAQLRANEQAGYYGQLANAVNQGRTADIGVASTQAGYNQQANLANQNASLNQNQLNQQNAQFYQALLNQNQQNQFNTNKELELQKGSDTLVKAGIDKGIAVNNSNQRAQNIGGLLNAGAQGGMLLANSDENLKTNIEPLGVDASKFNLFDPSQAASEKADENKFDFKKFLGGLQKGYQQGVAGEKEQVGPKGIFNDLSGTLNKAIAAGQTAAASGAALSDEDQKENKDQARGSNDLESFLDHVKAYKYDYKNPDLPGAGEGKHYSVMAQDLEKTPVGKSMVLNTTQGKMVDYAKGFGAILAAQADLHERMKKMEGRR